jgi:hypothetical protein
MTRYMTVEPRYASGLCIDVCHPRRVKRSRRRCIVPTFGKISIFMALRERLTLDVTSHGSPCDEGGMGCSARP